jgi:hypothetical protein
MDRAVRVQWAGLTQSGFQVGPEVLDALLGLSLGQAGASWEADMPDWHHVERRVLVLR